MAVGMRSANIPTRRWSVLLLLGWVVLPDWLVLLGWLVEALDLGALAQLGDEVGLRLARQKGLDLILHLVEFRRLLRAPVLDLDDVPAELRLHRIGELSRVHLERHIGEFG